MPQKVAILVDHNTGKHYIDVNASRNMEDIDPRIQDLMPYKSLEVWPCQQCAEVGVMNQAAKDGAELGKNLEMHTQYIDKKTRVFGDVERCKNCKETSRNINVTSDPK